MTHQKEVLQQQLWNNQLEHIQNGNNMRLEALEHQNQVLMYNMQWQHNNHHANMAHGNVTAGTHAFHRPIFNVNPPDIPKKNPNIDPLKKVVYKLSYHIQII